MIDVALLSINRRWHLRDHVSLREIAKRLGISRNTVRRYLRSGTIEPTYSRAAGPTWKPNRSYVRRPDVVIVNDPTSSPTQDNIRMVVEIKFPNDDLGDGQLEAYIRIAGSFDKTVLLESSECDCNQVEERERKTEELDKYAVPASQALYILLRMYMRGRLPPLARWNPCARPRSTLRRPMTDFHPEMSREAFAAALRENTQAQQFPGAMLMPKSRHDYVGAVIAITGTLYFEGGHTQVKRDAIAHCFEDYLAQVGDALTWLWRGEPPSGPLCMPYAKAPKIRDFFKTLDEDEKLDLQYTSGTKREDAGPYSFYVNAAPAWAAKKTGRLDVLRFAVPFVDIVEQPKAFQALFVEFAGRLQALHGHGGFGFVLSPSEWNSNQPTEAFASEQARGVDVGAPVFSAMVLKPNTLKTVSWLTAINRDMVAQAGGLHTLRSELPPDWFAFYDYGAGIVIQAGNEPDLAATAIDPKPPQYALPNAALKPLRSAAFGLHLAASAAGEPRLTGLKGEAWIERFDVSEDELLDVKARLLDTPRLDSSHSLDDRL